MINLRADKEVKYEAQMIAENLGLPLSTVINTYLKQFIRDKGLNISLTEPRLKPEVEKAIRQAENDYQLNKNISPAFCSAQEAIKYLDSIKLCK